MNKYTKKYRSKCKKSKGKRCKTKKNKEKKRKERENLRKIKGGFGRGACPFVGKEWNGDTGGNYLKLGTPIGVGSNKLFLGDIAPSPQRTFRSGPINLPQLGGGLISSLLPSPILNAYRGSLGGIQNYIREIYGERPLPSSLPWKQHQQQI